MKLPIRVLCLFTVLDRGGAETMCMNLYRNIDRNHVQFDFLVYYPQRGQYEDEIEELGGHVYRIPHLDPRNILAHIKGARLFFRNHPEYHIVHNHMGENGALICREAKRAGVSTIIYHSHVDKVPVFNLNHVDRANAGFMSMKQLKLRLLYPIAMRSSTDYFACGTNSARVFGNKKDEAQILNNAINLQRFNYKADKRLEKRREMQCGDSFIVGNVARINDNKNQAFAIKVIKELLKTHPNTQMWLVGDGNRKEELEKEVHKEGLSEHILFLGIRSDVAELMQAMDVFLFPSINEGLPVSCIEAQATGLPCVFSDGFDSNTVVTPYCTVLSLNDDICKWTQAIVKYIDFQRKDTSDMIRKAGYDIGETSVRMEKFYLSRS